MTPTAQEVSVTRTLSATAPPSTSESTSRTAEPAALERVLPIGVVTKVRLTTVAGSNGALRSYEARVLDAEGRFVVGAELDIGGLADDPDLRVRTTVMTPLPSDPTRYRAVVSFPADGAWVLVVRVGQPSEYVELFTENVTGVGPRPDAHDLASNPARRAVEAASPDFFARYDPTRLRPGSPLTTAELASAKAHDAIGVPGGQMERIEPTALGLSILHAAGALAWFISVLGLVLANRVGPGPARDGVAAFIARHYALLAGGGLLVVTITGISNVFNASPGLTTPTLLSQSGLGVTYLAVFAVKMVLVAGSLVATYRIGRLLRASALGSGRPLLSVGAMAHDPRSARALSLAEANARLGALILVCVGVLSQIHLVLH